MNRLILYEDLEGIELVLLCNNDEFYKGVFEKGDKPTIKEEIEIESDLAGWPTNRPLTADF